jgi:Cu+-exporting ATPase
LPQPSNPSSLLTPSNPINLETEGVSLLKNKKQLRYISSCAHCGETCNLSISIGEMAFCCEGCKQVYLILQDTDACNPALMESLGLVQPKGKFKSDKWDYLDESSIAEKLISFQNNKQVHITFILPNMHCASCIWLLEHLGRINKAIIHSKVDFEKKEIALVYNPQLAKLSEIAAVLDYIGYPPAINYASKKEDELKSYRRSTLLRLGIAGFCFSNIMMLSFPDYLSVDGVDEKLLSTTFNYISIILSIPVVFYAATPFFTQAWKGLRQKFLNIDAPIAFAITITYLRSLYEIGTATGTGYLDSMSGIVFFMLLGRWFQDKTQEKLSFERDYKSFFPISALVIKDEHKNYVPIDQIKTDDILLIRNQELIPADGILINGKAWIDYSFVTGEKDPVEFSEGEMLFAGGKQMGANISMKVTKPIASSHLTRLWNNDVFHNKKNKTTSFIHPLSNYFSTILFSIAFITAIYWEINDPAITWKAVTAILIVACPCSLLITATFTFGNLIHLFSKKGLYLKNANVIEQLASANTIVFDKTGTLSSSINSKISYNGKQLDDTVIAAIKAISLQSSHPLSKALATWDEWQSIQNLPFISNFSEVMGQGIEANCKNMKIKLGKADFVSQQWFSADFINSGSTIHLSIDGMYKGKFILQQQYREGTFTMIEKVKNLVGTIHILSGDDSGEEVFLKKSTKEKAELNFNKSPEDKLQYIQQLQQQGKEVIMIGDGLNDAGALQQSNVGLAVADNSNYFTPACDGILDGKAVTQLDKLILLARSGKKIIAAGFILSILYNIVGISYAAQGSLSPMIAAILMPASTISIIVLTAIGTKWAAKK